VDKNEPHSLPFEMKISSFLLERNQFQLFETMDLSEQFELYADIKNRDGFEFNNGTDEKPDYRKEPIYFCKYKEQ
jgi:hypothetical protein